jgi:hypothetical protein
MRRQSGGQKAGFQSRKRSFQKSRQTAAITTQAMTTNGSISSTQIASTIFFLHQLTPQFIPLVADPNQFASKVLRIVPRAGKLFFDVFDVASTTFALSTIRAMNA